MKRAWQAWVDLMSRKERGTTLALLRIAVGLVVVYSLLSIAGADLVDALWVDRRHGGMRTLPGRHWVIELLGGPTRETASILFWTSLAAAFAMVVGLGGRIAPLALVLAYHPLATINPDAFGGYEFMIGNAVWLLALGKTTATLSVDCRRKHGRWQSDELVSAWPRMILLLQLLVIYTATGLQKFSHDWVPGGSHAALYWVILDPTWTNFDLRMLAARFYPLTQLATLFAWVFEVTAMGLLGVLYLRDTAERGGRLRTAVSRFDLRIPWMAAGVGMHLGILVIVNVGPFSWISLCYYLCLWRPEDLDRFVAWVRRLARRKPSEGAEPRDGD